jgi:hypothetical protein
LVGARWWLAAALDLIVDMLEKARVIALLEILEDLPDIIFGDHDLLLCPRRT